MSSELALKILTDHNVNVLEGIITITGDVDEMLYEKLVQDIAILNLFNPDALENLTVMLSTYGGEVYYGFAIYDYLRLSVGKLKIICAGPVMSAGVLILQAAHDRVMLPNAHLLVHFGSEVNDNQQTKHHNEDLTKDIKKILIDRCKAKEQTVKKWFSKESYFDKNRAIAVGLVDRVLK